jgi:hypothetical protein
MPQTPKNVQLFKLLTGRELGNGVYQPVYLGLGATYLAIMAWYPVQPYPGTAKPWHKPDNC